MATITRGEQGVRQSSYAHYLAPIAGHTNVVVRRKVGEPCDTLHPSSRATRLQRNRFSKASTDWAALSYSHKKWWRGHWEYV